MRRGLLHVLAWLLATGAAVTLTWWGVHTVMAGTAYDPPRALPITAADTQDRGAPAPNTPTALPEPSRSAGEQKGGGEDNGEDGDGKKPSPTASAPSKSAKPGPRPGTGAPADPGEVKAYDTEGGRVVFSLGEEDATLVSATPGSGWSMQVWKTETWIRVDFAAGADRVSVFCTWHDSAPRVDVQNF